MSNEITLIPSRELVLQEFDTIKHGGTSDFLNLCVKYSSLKTEKCISISQNLSKELIDSKISNKIHTFFSIEREFTDSEINSNCAESQKKLASELDLDNEEVYYVSSDEEELKLIVKNYGIHVLNVSQSIEKLNKLLK